jgi:hypothetical protein
MITLILLLYYLYFMMFFFLSKKEVVPAILSGKKIYNCVEAAICAVVLLETNTFGSQCCSSQKWAVCHLSCL